MANVISKILLISITVLCVSNYFSGFHILKHIYNKELNIKLIVDDNVQDLIIKQGTLFIDILNKYHLNNKDLSFDYGLYEPLYDGEEIIISTSPSDKISINSATQEEFDSLPGIGPAIAKRIIEYRLSRTKFSFLDELKNVKGIGDKKFEQIKEFICL